VGRGSQSLINYILVNRKINPQVRDTTDNTGSDIYSDHYLEVSTVSLLEKRKRKNRNYKNKNHVVSYRTTASDVFTKKDYNNISIYSLPLMMMMMNEKI
jgi:hypothetical protein